MAWFPSRILHWLIGGGISNPEVGYQSSYPAASGEAVDVSDDRAFQISAVYRCIAILSQTVACMPLGFFERKADGRTELDDDHYIVTLLKRKPNPAMTPIEFRTAMTAQVAGWGNGYALVGYSGTSNNRRPTSLWPLKPERMMPYRQENGTLTYHYTTDKGVQILAPSSVFHLKGLTVDGVMGLSPLGMGRQALGLTIAAEKYSAGSFRNGGRPIGTLNFDKFLTPEQRDGARKLYQGITAGADAATNMWVLEGGAKYESISVSPDDMQMLESRRFQLGEICRLFGVPSHLVNDSEKATAWGSGLEQLNLGFLQYTLQPYLKAWESTITDSLLTAPDKRRVIVEHNVEGLLRADSAGRASFYSTMVQNGLMTRNEVRRKENLPPKEGGDELTAQVNMASIENLNGDPDAVQD